MTNENKTENVEEKKDNTTEKPMTPQEKLNGIIGLFIIGYVVYSLFGCVFSGNDSSSESSNDKSVSQASIQACNKALDAFNEAFTSNKYFQADATILKLKAIKTEVDYESGSNIACNIFIKNEGDKIIKGIYGYLYYFDDDNVSDKAQIYISNVIRPNETIKYRVSYISKSTTRAEIRNNAGDSIFNYDYSMDYDKLNK